MRQTLNRILIGLMVMLLSLTMASCKADKPYFTSDYLNNLVRESGLGIGDNIDQSISELMAYKVIENDEYPDYLTYAYLSLTLNNLIENDETGVKALKKKGIIDSVKDDEALVKKEDALKAIKNAVFIINNKEIERKEEITYKEDIKTIDFYKSDGEYLITDNQLNIGDLVYLEDDNCFKVISKIVDGKYLTREATFFEIYESIEISDDSELDLSKAIDLTSYEDDELYVNKNRTLLASLNTKRFTKKGFNVSYKITRNSINARISKNVDGLNFFYDLSVSNIKPSYNWKFKDENVENAYFKLDYKTIEEIGVSIGRYKNCYLDLKDLDASSFMNAAKSIVKDKSDEVEASIKICEIKVPLEGIPTMYFNFELLAKFYVSGKVELLIANKSSKGFEKRNGVIRFINDNDRDVDLKIGGSSSASVGLNFNLEAANTYLMDVETDFGIKGKVATTLHLYDEDNNQKILESDLAYSTYDDLSNLNENVKVCGDLSLYWMARLRFNTPRTLLSKFGMSKDIELLNEKDQLFGNKSHIENFVFVAKCTRNDRLKTSGNNSEPINVDKILLNKYSKVIKVNETYEIEIRKLPENYNLSDLEFSCKSEGIVSVNKGIVYGIKNGACEVVIATKDHKYSSSINILVSEG